MAGRASCQDCGEETEVGLEKKVVARDRNWQAFADAQVRQICGVHARELKKLRDSFAALESELSQDCDRWAVG